MAASRLRLSLTCLKGHTYSPILSWCLLSQLHRSGWQQVPVMCMSTRKHYNPRFRKQRRDKVKKLIDTLPNFDKFRADERQTNDERRTQMKKDGKLPRLEMDKDQPMSLRNTEEIIDVYKPEIGDGKSKIFGIFGPKKKDEEPFVVSQATPKNEEKKTIKERLKTRAMKSFKNPIVNFRAKRLIKQYDGVFNKKELMHQLQALYLEALECLEDVKKNEEKLFELVTDPAFIQLTDGLDKKTLRWQFIESLEPPKLMNIRIASIIYDQNYYAQLTVRMHTRQKLAIYDRCGRLMYGSEHLIKDVLEYIVFEKHIVDVYGKWRIHGKIEPDWQEGFLKEGLVTTIRKPADENL